MLNVGELPLGQVFILVVLRYLDIIASMLTMSSLSEMAQQIYK